MLTSITSLTAYVAMQAIIPKTAPRPDANLQIAPEQQYQADYYAGIAARLGLLSGDKITSWKAMQNISAGEKDKLIEVEMTEADRNMLIAVLEYDIRENEEVLRDHKNRNNVNSLVRSLSGIVDTLKSAVLELSTLNIEE